MPSVLTANTVPLKLVPPSCVVPYKVFPDKIKLPKGWDPSPPVKRCRFVKPVASVCKAKIVPLPESPPAHAVPYRVLPDKIKVAHGLAPSLFV